MYANCAYLRNVRCSIYKVEIISLAFRCLIILKSALKMRDQMHSPKNVFDALKHVRKMHVNMFSVQADRKEGALPL